MSKESKSRDRWAQLHASEATRAPDWCVGCGYYLRVTGSHRADCTRLDPLTAARCAQLGATS